MNDVWINVSRPKSGNDGSPPNVIDTCWLFKSNLNEEGAKVFKARMVICGFKDLNEYGLK